MLYQVHKRRAERAQLEAFRKYERATLLLEVAFIGLAAVASIGFLLVASGALRPFL